MRSADNPLRNNSADSIIKLVRDYDIRGYCEDFNDYGYVIGRIIGFKYKNAVIGKDDMPISSLIERTVIEGLLSSGANVFQIGNTITPVVYSAARKHKSCGIMITASHNGALWGGIKITGQSGIPVNGRDITGIISSHRDDGSDYTHLSSSRKIDPLKDYIDNLNARRYGNLRHIAWFTPNITINRILVAVFGDAIDIYHDEQIAEIMSLNRYKSGLGFDYDGDRLIVIDKTGHFVESDKLIMLFAQDSIKNKKKNIVLDYQIAPSIRHDLIKTGAKIILTRPGHSIVRSVLTDNNADFAGEISGHYYFKEHQYDDGIYAALQLIKILNNTYNIDSIFDETHYHCSPTLRIDIKGNRTDAINAIIDYFKINPRKWHDGNLLDFGNSSVLLRTSGTENALVCRIYADNAQELKKTSRRFGDALGAAGIG